MFHVERVVKNFFPDKDLAKIMAQFAQLKELYFKWNNKINISSIRDEESFWIKHIIDSLCLAKYIKDNFENKDVLDVGSGGGFPALVLSLILDSNVVALEPIKKKTDFIDHCSFRLKLKNIKTVNSKFGELNKSYSVVVSRALGLYKELCDHFFGLDQNTKIVIMTTSKNIEGFDYQYKLGLDEYAYANSECSDKLKDHVLCECFYKKNN